MSQLYANETTFPEWAKGSLEDCSRGMMEAYVTRPQTMTYPKLANTLYRNIWYFKPNFHEGIIERMKPKGAQGTGYKEMVDKMKSKEKAELRKKMGYQQGYGGE